VVYGVENTMSRPAIRYVRTCKTCGKDFSCRSSEDRPKLGHIRTYCSLRCLCNRQRTKEEYAKKSATLKKILHTEEWNRKVAKSKFRSKNPAWIDGRTAVYGFGWTRAIRKLVRSRDGDTCQKCGRMKTTQKQSFPIHHIDGSKTNHRPENLIVLCRPCHIKTHKPETRIGCKERQKAKGSPVTEQ
jgi:hypothetical protein